MLRRNGSGGASRELGGFSQSREARGYNNDGPAAFEITKLDKNESRITVELNANLAGVIADCLVRFTHNSCVKALAYKLRTAATMCGTSEEIKQLESVMIDSDE